MFFRNYALRYAVVIFLSAIFVIITGLLVYAFWFSPPREPPSRSLPVSTASIYPGSSQATANMP